MKTLWLLALLALPAAVLQSPLAAANEGPLRSYVGEPETVFQWQHQGEQVSPGFIVHYLELTSQVWQQQVWQHRLRVIVPDGVNPSHPAILYITGSGSGQREIDELSVIAELTQAPLGVLHDIPNQPLFGGMREDQIIAYTFDKFLETKDPNWPLLLPMVKGAVAAMDTFAEFWQQETGVQDLSFVVTGGSKRGWTTWLTAAVDQRVAAIAPIVYDNLNLQAQMDHQLASWGSYSLQIDDYTERGLQAQLATEAGRKLASLVDPWAYVDQITVPTMIIQGTNDPYWVVDALNLYFDDLVGDSYIVYVPNTGHGMENPQRAIFGLGALHQSLVHGGALPQPSWTFSLSDEGMAAYLEPAAADQVIVWQATAPIRDFRQAQWEYEAMAPGVSEFSRPALEETWQALFVEFVYDMDERPPLRLSSQIQVIPPPLD